MTNHRKTQGKGTIWTVSQPVKSRGGLHEVGLEERGKVIHAGFGIFAFPSYREIS
jgi:hypothetical protein